ncbi:flightin [Periplaneta americana]|uniref:flightin n=1 Tax=Periplaneta americana TaxID=6978 RepID=UPI0037E7C08F
MADEPAPAEAPAPEAPPAESLPPPQPSKSRDPNRQILFRHWSRPTHLQYRYLYDYRHNYYNDVIDYLDRKTRGLNRDIPRAQTWAERVLRTYTKDVSSAANTSRNRDIELLTSIRACNNYYTYHSRDYLVRRYPALAL